MRFSELTPGYEFPSVTFALDAETVERYLAATEDDNALYWRDGTLHLVPPLAVGALAFRDIARELALEPGSLHTAQELTFHRPVLIGERLTTQAHVTASSKRRGFTVLIIEIAAIDDGGEFAVSGRMTVMVAGAESEINLDGKGASQDAGVQSAGHVAAAGAPGSAHYAPLQPSAVVAGLELGPLLHTVTQERIDRYAEASGDYNPIHIDPVFAGSSPFGGTIAHGMLLLAYLSSLLTRAFGPAWINTGTLKVRFRNPAPAGVTVAARGRVERVDDAAHGVQYAVCALALENAAGEALITGEARVDMKRL